MMRRSIVALSCATLLACTHRGSPAAAQSPAAQSPAGGGPRASQSSDTVASLLAAGDIASCSIGAWQTARLLDSLPGEIIIAGDAAYSSARDPNPYRTCFDSTWGRHKARVHPAPGNHDVSPRSVMRMYFTYFGKAAGREPGGYYSFDVGSWHVIALNSTIEMSPRSRQGRWVAADLKLNQARCTLAFFHHPRFSSGPHSKAFTTRDVFPTLVRGGVDVIVSGHDHIYERFAPMLADGSLNDGGIRQFVVGTGGNLLYELQRVEPNSEAASNETFGVLKLTLDSAAYAWEFVPVVPGAYRDTGSADCH